MANKMVVPKCWQLKESETLNSYVVWQENVVYTLSLDDNFDIFLQPGMQWLSSTTPARGLTDDPPTMEINRRTKEKKVIHLGLMLGQIHCQIHCQLGDCGQPP